MRVVDSVRLTATGGDEVNCPVGERPLVTVGAGNCGEQFGSETGWRGVEGEAGEGNVKVTGSSVLRLRVVEGGREKQAVACARSANLEAELIFVVGEAADPPEIFLEAVGIQRGSFSNTSSRCRGIDSNRRG